MKNKCLMIIFLGFFFVFILTGYTSIVETNINKESPLEKRKDNIEPFKECLFGVCRGADVPVEIECNC